MSNQECSIAAAGSSGHTSISRLALPLTKGLKGLKQPTFLLKRFTELRDLLDVAESAQQMQELVDTAIGVIDQLDLPSADAQAELA